MDWNRDVSQRKTFSYAAFTILQNAIMPKPFQNKGGKSEGGGSGDDFRVVKGETKTKTYIRIVMIASFIYV